MKYSFTDLSWVLQGFSFLCHVKVICTFQICLCSEVHLVSVSRSGQWRRASTCLTKARGRASVWLVKRRSPSGSSSCCPPILRRTTVSRISFSPTSLSLKVTWTNSRAPSNRWINVYYCYYRPTTCCSLQKLNFILIFLLCFFPWCWHKGYFLLWNQCVDCLFHSLINSLTDTLEHKLVSEIWIDPTCKPYTLYSCNELSCCLFDIPCISVVVFTGVCCWHCQSSGWLPVLSSICLFAPLPVFPLTNFLLHLSCNFSAKISCQIS